jgi:hypothetical protein
VHQIPAPSSVPPSPPTSPSRYAPVLIAALGLWLSIGIPILPAPAAGYDDGLFFSLAQSIAAHRWLGGFSNLVLAKGPAFPIFLAAVFKAAIPYGIAIYSVYLGGAAILMSALRSRLKPPVFLGLWALLALNPAYFAMNRVIRENFYAALFLIALGLVVSIDRQRSGWHYCTIGLTFAFLYVCREEAVSDLAFLVVLLAVMLWQIRRHVSLLIPVVAMVGSFLSLWLAIALLNFANYGYFGITEMTSGWFPKFYGQLTAIEDPEHIDYVPLSQAGLDRAYSVSPTLTILEPLLKGRVRDTWAGKNSFACGVYPTTCGNYVGGWFLWALRDATATAGYYANASKAQEFYHLAYQELRDACQDRLVPCHRPTGFVDLQSLDGDRFGRSVLTGLGYLFRFQFEGPMLNYNESYVMSEPALRAWVGLLNTPSTWGTDGVPNFRLQKLVFEGTVKLFQMLNPTLLILGIGLAIARLFRFNLPASFRTLNTSEPSLIPFLRIWMILHLIAKLVILSIIDVTAFKGLTTHYMAILYIEVIILSILGLVHHRPPAAE